MKFQQLRYFASVAQHGSLSRAAEQLCVAQPALTRQIQLLERELEVILFLRRARGVALTEAGKILLNRCETVLRSVERVKSELGDLGHQPRGTIRIGCTPGLTDHLAVEAIHSFMTKWPDVKIHLQEHPSDILRKAVLSEELDIAILTAKDPHSDLETQHIFNEPIHLFGQVGSLDGHPINLQTISDRRLILARRSLTTREVIERLFTEKNIKPEIIMETDSILAVARMVSRGAGYTVAPKLSLQRQFDEGQITSSAIHDFWISRVMIWRRDAWITQGLKEFINEVQLSAQKLKLNKLKTKQEVENKPH